MNINLIGVTIALVLVSTHATAAWKEFDRSGATSFYIDLETLKINGDKRMVWTLVEAKTPDGSISVGAQMEFDCVNEIERTLAAGSYSEPMGRGVFKRTDAIFPDWKAVAPGTVSYKRMQAACISRR